MMHVQLLFIGTTELLLISGIALLLFGGKKLPEMMRGLGKGVREFKKGVNEVEQNLNTEEEGAEAENNALETVPETTDKKPSSNNG